MAERVDKVGLPDVGVDDMRPNDLLPDDRLRPLLQAVEAFRADHGTVSVLHLSVFLVVATRSPLRVGDISKALGIAPTSVSTALARLVEEEHCHQPVGPPAGLISLEQHPEDRRIKIASLTAKGRHIVLAMRDVMASAR